MKVCIGRELYPLLKFHLRNMLNYVTYLEGENEDDAHIFDGLDFYCIENNTVLNI